MTGIESMKKIAKLIPIIEKLGSDFDIAEAAKDISSTKKTGEQMDIRGYIFKVMPKLLNEYQDIWWEIVALDQDITVDEAKKMDSTEVFKILTSGDTIRDFARFFRCSTALVAFV